MTDIIRAQDKRILNGKTDVLQLEPFRFPNAWDAWEIMSRRNLWFPQEIRMGDDKLHFAGGDLSEAEKYMLSTSESMLTAMDMLTEGAVQAIRSYLTCPEYQQALTAHAFQEGIHVHAYKYVADELGFDPVELFNRYRTIPEIKAKVELANAIVRRLVEHEHDTMTRAGRQDLLVDMIFWYVGFEMVWFLSGLTPVISMKRKHSTVGGAARMSGTVENFEYIFRDETFHGFYGAELINSIKQEWPDCWEDGMPEQAASVLREMVDLELKCAEHIIPIEILTINRVDYANFVRSNAEKFAKRVGVTLNFGAPKAPVYLSEMLDLKKEKNFFETRIQEYQSGSALDGSWD